MFRRQNPFFIIFIPPLFLFLSTCFPLSHALQHDNAAHLKSPGVLSLMKRQMEETRQGNHSVILAAKETRRPDPTNNFRTYTGGWDITSQHYFASVSYSAIPFLVMAVIWFVLMGIFVLCACICCCFCQRKKPYGYSRYVYAFSLVCLILFTMTSIAGSSVMFTGERRFLESVKKFTSYLVNKGISIWESLVRIEDLLLSAKEIALNKKYVPDELRDNIDEADKLIDSIGRLPRIKAQDITDDIRNSITDVNSALIDIASIMLVLAFFGFLSDTCVAMDEWVQNPKANSALEDLLPCAEKEAGEKVKEAGKEVTTSINDLLNQVVNFSNGNTAINQSGPLVPFVCNPYEHGNSQLKCGDQVPLKNAKEEWKKYVCQVSEEGNCTTPGRLTPDMYEEMSKAVNISDGLYNSSFVIADIVDCTVVEDAFRNITLDHCPNLMKYSAWVYGGLVTSTISVMFCLFFWVLYAREREHRNYTKRINKGYDESPLVGGKKL
ncbi:hypothetical protein V6N12_062461 [Hibiscus sabdariffa]|uniref:Uncharacterized protein n=1 Tax=Hibiscus sabdariffa TaxID=183260 RepID=A0ABR2F921_9ROSI